MTKISAEIVADSICNGHRITTMLLVYPRFIHSEMCRHRMFSRNTASSRAIPPEKMIEAVKNDPVIPIAWQKQHRGMQGTEYFTPDDPNYDHLPKRWLYARDNALSTVKALSIDGVTKQIINRLLEPWMWTVELVTATEWENFFHLRCPQYYFNDDCKNKRSRKEVIEYCKTILNYDEATLQDLSNQNDLWWLGINKGQAEIHMMALAEAMWDARNESKPKELQPGEWHIPFGDNMNEEGLHYLTSYKADYGGVHSSEITDYLKEQTDLKVKVAVARAARTSYTVVGANLVTGDGAHVAAELYRKDIELHDRLLESGHMSPFEHCAQAMTERELDTFLKGEIYVEAEKTNGDWQQWLQPDDHNKGWCHNLRGWKSYRSMIPNENRR